MSSKDQRDSRKPPAPPGNEEDWLPERGWWQLVPKRTLLKAVWLLMLLGAVLWFRARSTSCVATFAQFMAPDGPAQSPRPSSGSRGEAGRTVRLAPSLMKEPAMPPAPSPPGGTP